MRPDASLAGLLGLGSDVGDLAERLPAGPAPGRGITGETMQFHDTADLWTPVGARRSRRRSSRTRARRRGARGDAAQRSAPARPPRSPTTSRGPSSTRAGQPGMGGRERDGIDPDPVRRHVLRRAGDCSPTGSTWTRSRSRRPTSSSACSPNLITEMNADRMPLPRFWYLPRGEKAAVIMTGDDHGNGGTDGRSSTASRRRARRVAPSANWECIRSTSYVFPGTRSPTPAGVQATGFEIALHVNTGCAATSRRRRCARQLGRAAAEFARGVPACPRPRPTGRTASPGATGRAQPKVEREHGIRLDTNYYYWPGQWVQNRPGMFTGSGLPMRFADTDGSLIDVYQAATQMTDESGIDYAGAHRGAAGRRARRAGLLRRVHGEHAHGRRRPRGRRRDRGCGEGARRAGGLGPADADVARRPQRLVVRRSRRSAATSCSSRSSRAPAPTAWRRCCRSPGPTGALTGSRAAARRSRRRRDGQGHRIRRLRRGGRRLRATYGEPPVSPAPDTTITAFTVTGDTASAAFASDVAGATFQCRLDGAAFQRLRLPASSPAWPPVSTHSRSARIAGGRTDPLRPSALHQLSATPPSGGHERRVGGGESGGPGTSPDPGAVLGDSRRTARAPQMIVRTRRARGLGARVRDAARQLPAAGS